MFKRKVGNNLSQIEKATNLANNAVKVFRETINDLVLSNDLLEEEIAYERDKIIDANRNISIATTQIKSNDTIMNKLKDFIS